MKQLKTCFFELFGLRVIISYRFDKEETMYEGIN